MKQLIFFTLLSCFMIIVLSNCKKDKKPCACGVEDPQVNIEWLKDNLNKRFCVEVYLLQNKGQEFIGIYDCPEMVDGGYAIYNCDGTKICEYSGLAGKGNCTYELVNDYKTLIYKQNK